MINHDTILSIFCRFRENIKKLPFLYKIEMAVFDSEKLQVKFSNFKEWLMNDKSTI